MSLRWRVAIAATATALLAVAVTTAVGSVLASRFLERAATDDLARQAAAITATLDVTDRPALRDVAPERRDAAVQSALQRLGLRGTLIDPDTPGRLLEVLVPPEDRARLRAGATVTGVGDVEGRTVAWAAAPGFPGVLTYRGVGELDAAADEVVQRLGAAGLLATAVAALTGIVVGGRLSRPIRRLDGTVAAVAGGNLEARPADDVSARGDEIGDLARGVEVMTARLARQRQQQRSFFRSVAHDLRTPLTNLRGYAEGLVDGHFDTPDRRAEAATVIHDESRRLARLVDDVTMLGRVEAGQVEVAPSAVGLDAVAAQTVTAFREVADAGGVDLDAEVRPVTVVTDPHLLRRVVDNLVANALRVTPHGGRVVLRGGPSGDGARIEVADDGPGLTGDDVAVAFDRYALWQRYRGVREVGTGLGLAIVAELTTVLGGSVTVDPGGSGDPGGATFTVDLPARVPPPAGGTG